MKTYDDRAERLNDDDPLVFFRSSPVAAAAPAEVDAMKKAVAELRRVRALETSSRRDLGLPRTASLRVRRPFWAAAAAAAAALVLALTFATTPEPPVAPALATVAGPSVFAQAELALVEDFSSSHELIQIEDEQLSLVIVVGQD